MDSQITQWADELEETRSELELDEERYPIALGLALIATESAGNPKARKVKVHRSEFWGLLQQGHMASLDLGWEPRGGKRGWRTAERLHGNGLLAIESWYRLLHRYRDRWGYEGAPLELTAAILWKGGAGTARRIRARIQRDGLDVWTAARWIETHENNRWRIPNLTEYLRRVERNYRAAQTWVNDEYERGQVIEPEPSFHVASSLLELGWRLFEMTRA